MYFETKKVRKLLREIHKERTRLRYYRKKIDESICKVLDLTLKWKHLKLTQYQKKKFYEGYFKPKVVGKPPEPRGEK